MSEIRVNKVINAAGTGSVELTQGATLPSGKTLSGAGDLNLTGIVTAASGSFTGSVSIGGTITYDDVTNIDSVGIVTAGKGFRATTGGIIVTAGISTLSGVEVPAGGLTITAGESYFGGGLSEKATIVANKLSAAANIDVSTGNVWYFSTNETTTGTPNLRWDGSTTLASKLATGDSVSVSIISKPNGAGYYAQMTIDGVAQTEEWNGGSAPASANAGGYDITTYQILKTGSGTTDYIVLANVSNFA